MAVRASIVLVLHSSLEDPLSDKRAFTTKSRVRAFVLLAIAFFVAAGFAANRYVAGTSRSPDVPPAEDSAVLPSPQGSAVGIPTPTPIPSATPSPANTRTHRPSRTPVASKHVRVKPSRHLAAAAKNLSAEDLVVRLTNLQRERHGCSALRNDPRLRTAAREHSEDMRVRHYFEHNSPDGRTPWDRIEAAGYSMPGAENIAMGYATAQAVVDGWMNSPGHRANILNCSLKAVGIGVEYGPSGPWWTQDFGFR